MAQDHSTSGVLHGGCACGQVRYSHTGPTVLSLKCHCTNCQRWTGVGHSAQVWGWLDCFELTGSLRYAALPGDSGKKVEFGSCTGCGCPVAVKIELIPAVIGMVASSLDAPEDFRPEFAIWTQSAPAWDVLDPSLQSFENGFRRDVLLPRLQRQ